LVENSIEWVERPSYAKLNLMLDVVEKREDGYHNIVSLFQEISLHDTIKVKFIKEGFEIDSTRPLPDDNTLHRAYKVFREKFKLDFGLHIKVIKRIPAGAGLGGGSSNAATLLKILGEHFNVDKEDLLKVAKYIGSDVTFFLYGGTALVEGRGEIITPLDDLAKYGVILFVPKVRVSTKFAYQTLREEDFGKAPCSALQLYEAYVRKDYQIIKKCSYNIFEEILLNQFVEIDRTKKLLERDNDVIVAMMTGSGSGVFGIVESGRGSFSFVGKEKEKALQVLRCL